jgi:hypothetical protein
MKYLGAPQSGSQANTTASHNRAGQYYRNRRTPTQPVGTGRRAIARANFGASSSAWASLSSAAQAAWIAFAASHPITDALGQSITLTGHQMFVSCSAQLLNVNQPISSAVPGSTATTAPVILQFSPLANGVIYLNLDGSGSPSDFLTFSFGSPQSTGVTFLKTFWQALVDEADVTFEQNLGILFTNQFGTMPPTGRVFLQVKPVNQYGFSGVPVITYQNIVPAESALVASSPVTLTLDWTWAGANPDSWIVFTSGDGGINWEAVPVAGGATRLKAGLTAGNLAFVVGVDSLGNISLGNSNTVPIHV